MVRPSIGTTVLSFNHTDAQNIRFWIAFWQNVCRSQKERKCIDTYVSGIMYQILLYTALQSPHYFKVGIIEFYRWERGRSDRKGLAQGRMASRWNFKEVFATSPSVHCTLKHDPSDLAFLNVEEGPRDTPCIRTCSGASLLSTLDLHYIVPWIFSLMPAGFLGYSMERTQKGPFLLESLPGNQCCSCCKTQECCWSQQLPGAFASPTYLPSLLAWAGWATWALGAPGLSSSWCKGMVTLSHGGRDTVCRAAWEVWS